MNFFDNLSIRYNRLTKQGKRLADYICENVDETLTHTAKTLGEKSGTSASSVIRVCQQMGYKSFEQMKISLAVESSRRELNTPIDTIISEGDSIHDIAEKLFFNMTDALRKTLELIDYNEIKKAILLIEKAKTIYVFGIGSSRFAAQELSHRLNRIGKPCIYQLEGHTNLEMASVAGKKDLVIAFSYSGETKEVYLAAKTAKHRGCAVISVTRDRANLLKSFATVSLITPNSEKRIRVGAFSSRGTQMFIGDILYFSLLQRNFGKLEGSFIETSRIVNQLKA